MTSISSIKQIILFTVFTVAYCYHNANAALFKTDEINNYKILVTPECMI